MRRRRSTSASSGTSMTKDRIDSDAPASPDWGGAWLTTDWSASAAGSVRPRLAPSRPRLRAPTAAEKPIRNLRRSGVETSGDMVILPQRNGAELEVHLIG